MYAITMLCAASILALLSSAVATPMVRKSLNPANLRSRSPFSAATFEASADWPTNVVFTGGSQSYGLWVPPDDTWYDFENIQCLGVPAYAIGDCNDITIDQIGVVAGYGPCTFVGSTGSSITVAGNAGDGFTTVGPPQTILSGRCGET